MPFGPTVPWATNRLVNAKCEFSEAWAAKKPWARPGAPYPRVWRGEDSPSARASAGIPKAVKGVEVGPHRLTPSLANGMIAAIGTQPPVQSITGVWPIRDGFGDYYCQMMVPTRRGTGPRAMTSTARRTTMRTPKITDSRPCSRVASSPQRTGSAFPDAARPAYLSPPCLQPHRRTEGSVRCRRLL